MAHRFFCLFTFITVIAYSNELAVFDLHQVKRLVRRLRMPAVKGATAVLKQGTNYDLCHKIRATPFFLAQEHHHHLLVIVDAIPKYARCFLLLLIYRFG